MRKTGLPVFFLLASIGLSCSTEAEEERLEIIIDNRDEGFHAELGDWSTGLAPDTSGECYLDDFLYAEPRASGDPTARHRARFTPEIVNAGEYSVFMWWPSGSENATAAPVAVFHAGGQHSLTINLRQHGDDWFFIGTYDFDAGTAGALMVEDSDTGRTYADAVRFLYTGEPVD